MKTLEQIYNEVSEQLHKDNCQSVPNICKASMEEALNEYNQQIIDDLYEILEEHKTEQFINRDKIINYIHKLESKNNIFTN
jgi:hypothetical protein